MFFTTLQAMHGGKVIFFLDAWEEGDPDCKLLNCIQATFRKERFWWGYVCLKVLSPAFRHWKAPSEIFFLEVMLFPAFPPTFPYFIGGVTWMQLNRFAIRSSSFYPSKKKIILPPCIACNVVKNTLPTYCPGTWVMGHGCGKVNFIG
jgi:hypothetical protein